MSRRSRGFSSATTSCPTPVVDEAGRLVGVITIDDIVDVLQEEADDEIKALGGVRADEELSDTVWSTSREAASCGCS